ncbi:ketopantoate reductase family protein [Arenibaculum pallidiluteum]|uniref:ketopantoate reductase family protein n=1 Tax=Arenibaculum pallidiluteum TaxID=2812559 RepID=UPI001A971726|nr:2-dehydropantoate 2-reductase [Arenibaculum pallidiluteum]
MRRICIFGAGAIGGHLAARLAEGGAEVSIVARGEQLSAIRERGIVVRTHDGTLLRCRPRIASDDPREIGPQDAVLVTVKAPALPQVAACIAPLLDPATAVAFVMNGLPWWYADGDTGPLAPLALPELDPDGALHRAVAAERVIGGVVYSACTVVEPGLIHSEHASIKLVLGEPDGRVGARAGAIANFFQAGGMPCEVTPDIRAEVWGKLLGNLASGPLCLLSRRSMLETFSDPAIRAAAVRIVEEGMALAAAVLGHPLGGSAETRIARLADTDHKPSILQDLEMGRPLEVQALFSLPLRLARIAGVPTPTLDLMVALAARTAGLGGR